MKKVEVIFVSNSDQYNLCLEIRRQVFIEEQCVPESIEVDQYEQEAKHFLALIDGKPVGTGRLRVKKSYVKFERIATLKSQRGCGVGRILMEAMQEYAAQQFPTHLPAMHAQQSALGFYEKIGWIPVGEEFFEAAIPHRVLIYPPQDRKQVNELKIWKDSESREDIRAYLKLLSTN